MLQVLTIQNVKHLSSVVLQLLLPNHRLTMAITFLKITAVSNIKTLRKREVRGIEATFNVTRAACPFVKTKTVRSKVSEKKSTKYKTTQRTIALVSWKLRNWIWIPPISLCVYVNEIAKARNQEIAHELKSAISKPRGTLEIHIVMEYITMCLDSTNKLEQWYVRHNNVYCLHPRATCFNLYTGHLQAFTCTGGPEDDLCIG